MAFESTRDGEDASLHGLLTRSLSRGDAADFASELHRRHLQPEMVGSLGLLEMQAGPRCRAVVKTLRRLDAPADSLPCCDEHAHVDPRHGKEWLERVIAPLAHEPGWATRTVRGAQWRAAVNGQFFAEAHEHCTRQLYVAA